MHERTIKASEGINWKARDLWCAPVKRSSHTAGVPVFMSTACCCVAVVSAVGMLLRAALAHFDLMLL